MKNSNDNIGNGTRDLPACSAVPQPTEPPRARIIMMVRIFKRKRKNLIELDEEVSRYNY